MPERHHVPAPVVVLAAAITFVLVTVAACQLLPSTPGASPTPHVVYVTPTPEGTLAETAPPAVAGVSATPSPHVVYVTATPDGWTPPPAEATVTPYVIYVTATPLIVGPFGSTPIVAEDLPEPTLDLSGITQVPTVQQSPTPSAPTQTPTPTATPVIPRPREGALYSNRLGINFISSAQHWANEERFQQGIDVGAGWDRFAIYWHDIEQQPNRYDWGIYDRAVRDDVIYGLQTDGILLGFPDIYRGEGAVPQHIHQPVFADGSDVPGAGKELNPDNAWAEFVYHTVERYRPGGTLAAREGWPEGAGVRVWEIWNEPDFQLFWQGSVEEYARLLKVAYIAARQADPEAQIMIGGLVMFEQPDFIYRLLDIYKNDEQPVEGRYPFNIVALHSYSHPAHSFYILQRVETLLATHNLGDMPIWLNESGVAVWDDYPGPEWATRPDQVIWRASMGEQAAYLVQNAAFAFLGEAGKLFHFQLYDDCGNQPAGTTFAPHDGSLCENGNACWGDALGLLRNRADNVCFNQHPEPGTARPAYDAFRRVSDVFGGQPVVPLTGYSEEGRQFMIFARPEASQLITVVWDESGQAGEIAVQARSTSADVILPNGEQQTIQPGPDGTYRLRLEAAANRAQAEGSAYEFMIGGPPVILIESSSEPIVTALPLLDTTRTAALVKWRTSHPSQIVRYEVYYRDDTSGSGEWVRWIEADQPGEALFTPNAERSYSFFVRGQLPDGRWTADAPYAQAWTAIE